MKLTALNSAGMCEKSIFIHGENIPYTFEFETATFTGGAEITAFTYIMKDASPERPVLFITNGGPGSSVCWLHLGLFGPRRIHLDDPIHPQTVPPYALEDNPHCLLDICDLVLMDPPGAGFSAGPDAETAKEFFSVDGDAQAFSLFIEKWTERHGRANSPLYFVGESYGTMRGPALADALFGGPFTKHQRLLSVSLSGILSLGTAFTTAATMLQKPPVEESVLNLPCCAATTAYHYPGRFPSPADAAEAAWEFAPEYLTALFMGNALPEEKRTEIAEKLQRFTNIPAPALLANGLRYSMEQFKNTVLPGRQVGGYDGRYTMDGPGKPGNFPMPGMKEPIAEDAAMGMYTPAFIGGMNLLRQELSLPEGTYGAINFAINAGWDYSSNRPALHSLENAMRRNPSMRLFFGTGLYDLVTVPGNVRYTLQNSALPPERVTALEYESGHMPYLGEDSAEKLEADIRAFIRENL